MLCLEKNLELTVCENEDTRSEEVWLFDMLAEFPEQRKKVAKLIFKEKGYDRIKFFSKAKIKESDLRLEFISWISTYLQQWPFDADAANSLVKGRKLKRLIFVA